MPYGTIKVDNVIYTKGGVDTTITVSGIVDSLSGAISVTGAISGASVSAPTGTFTTLSGNTTAGTTATFVTGVFTTSLSGATITGNTGQFSNITGVSGVFTTRISGATITGNTGQFSSITGISGVFTSVSGTTFTVTSGVFASGTAAAPSVSVGTTTNGLYSSATNEVALATNSSSRLVVDASGNVNIDSGTFYVDAVNNRVGIGTTGPSNPLHVVGTGRFNVSGSNNVVFGADSGDPYIYAEQNTALKFGTNSTLRATLDAAGNLGLGVTPDVGYGKEFSISAGTTSGVGGLGVRNLAIGNNVVYLANNTQNTGAFSDSYWTSSPATKYAQNQGNHYWYTAPSGTAGSAITFTQAMTLDASGRLLVGTTSMLGTGGADVLYARDSYAGGIYTGQLGAFDTSAYNNGPIAGVCFGFKYNTAGAFGIAGNIQVLKENTTDGNYASAMRFMTRANGADVGERARIDSSGRLLVGTTSATNNIRLDEKLTVVGNSNTGSTGVSFVNYSGTVDHGAIIDLCKSRGASDGVMTIVQAGDNLGYLVFRGSDGTSFNDAALVKAVVEGTPAAGKIASRLVFSTTADGAASPTERLRIQESGDLRIANATAFYPATDNAVAIGANVLRFSVVYAVNGTIQTSDEREKTAVTDSSLGTSFIKSLRPVSYKWIEGGKRATGERDDDNNYIYESVPGERTHWGFIAQEVKQAVDAAGVDFGGWVLTDKDDPDSQQALRYDQFIAPLTKALQEALEKIETLEAKVAALESR